MVNNKGSAYTMFYVLLFVGLTLTLWIIFGQVFTAYLLPALDNLMPIDADSYVNQQKFLLIWRLLPILFVGIGLWYWYMKSTSPEGQYYG